MGRRRKRGKKREKPVEDSDQITVLLTAEVTIDGKVQTTRVKATIPKPRSDGFQSLLTLCRTEDDYFWQPYDDVIG